MQRYFAATKNKEILTLDNSDIHHILHVMRMNDNDNIEVVYEEQLYLCSITINGEQLLVKVINQIEKINKAKHITLIVPLVKEQKLDYILQKSTELGASAIILVEMQRSVVKMVNEKQEKKIDRWTKICKEASEQSMRLNIPVISQYKSIKDIKIDTGLNLICSTKIKENNIRKSLQNNQNYDRITVAIGPEGGFTPEEENYLIDKGFIPVTLGHNIMRVETVPLFILSVINYENME